MKDLSEHEEGTPSTKEPNIIPADRATPVDWYPQKGSEIVGRMGNFMVKYLVKNVDRSRGYLRVEVVGVQPLPEGAKDETPIDATTDGQVDGTSGE